MVCKPTIVKSRRASLNNIALFKSWLCTFGESICNWLQRLDFYRRPTIDETSPTVQFYLVRGNGLVQLQLGYTDNQNVIHVLSKNYLVT
ncbi:hypothetical protein KUL156_62700 [Alteromonas sp. KUL156]|nr:hypothetical protein KUL156_62700 [Alteromonas sp. KUL156]